MRPDRRERGKRRQTGWHGRRLRTGARLSRVGLAAPEPAHGPRPVLEVREADWLAFEEALALRARAVPQMAGRTAAISSVLDALMWEGEGVPL